MHKTQLNLFSESIHNEYICIDEARLDDYFLQAYALRSSRSSGLAQSVKKCVCVHYQSQHAYTEPKEFIHDWGYTWSGTRIVDSTRRGISSFLKGNHHHWLFGSRKEFPAMFFCYDDIFSFFAAIFPTPTAKYNSLDKFGSCM